VRRALAAGALAAWAHGRAAELATRRRDVRGVPLHAVLETLPRVWALRGAPARYPVLAIVRNAAVTRRPG
jgi:hypothetical protein